MVLEIDGSVRGLTDSNASNLLRIGPSFLPRSSLNAPGSGAASKRMAVFVGFVDLLTPRWELDKVEEVGRVVDGAEAENKP